MSDRDDVISWLQDAYSMERGIEKILENHVKDAEGLPEMHPRLKRHLDETRRQAERLEACLKDLDTDVSTAKSTMGSVMGKMNGAMTGMYRDELVKNALAQYSTEHFEIACYKSLIAAARRAGLWEVVQVCQDILSEEEGMAEWVGGQIESITQRWMDKARADEAA